MGEGEVATSCLVIGGSLVVGGDLVVGGISVTGHVVDASLFGTAERRTQYITEEQATD